jgi:hypothetical protein
MKKTRLVLSLLLCTFFLTSCTRTILLQIFNNTGEDLTVISYELKGEKSYSIGKGQSARVQISNRLTVKTENKAWDFEVKPVPRTTSYMLSERFGPLVVKLQIEQNGTIYLLAAETSGVTNSFPPQPPGFPLHPEKAQDK